MANYRQTISTTVTKLVGPDAEEMQVAVQATASITPPDRSVGIDTYSWEDLTITNNDGDDIEVSEAECERLGEQIVAAYLQEEDDAITFARKGGAPSEFYD